jgi:hypothetical protein
MSKYAGKNRFRATFFQYFVFIIKLGSAIENLALPSLLGDGRALVALMLA